MYIHVHVHVSACLEYSVVGPSPTRGSSFFLGKVTTLGVLCCFASFVCLTLLLSLYILLIMYIQYMYILLRIMS